MQEEAADAFFRLQCDASDAGYRLAIASSFRSFERQKMLWNGKASGLRPVHDDEGKQLEVAELSPHELLHAILRFSALPGTSRHHWGTDVDVFDLVAAGESYDVQLTPQEVAPGGLFDSFHCWLDGQIAADKSYGFFRPYARDNGGVAVERWHLSYAPVSISCAGQISANALTACWDDCGDGIMLRSEVEVQLPAIMRRYLAVEENWCPGFYRQTS